MGPGFKTKIVPALWQLEFANVLKTAYTQGKLSLDSAREIVDTMVMLPIELDAGVPPSPRQMFELAMRYNLCSYDAAYLELAMRLCLPIACQDSKLKEAAVLTGVGVVS